MLLVRLVRARARLRLRVRVRVLLRVRVGVRVLRVRLLAFGRVLVRHDDRYVDPHRRYLLRGRTVARLRRSHKYVDPLRR